jgi:hypothetical protein
MIVYECIFLLFIQSVSQQETKTLTKENYTHTRSIIQKTGYMNPYVCNELTDSVQFCRTETVTDFLAVLH